MRVVSNVDMKNAGNKLRAIIEMYGKTAALRLEGEAKQKAPWTDRTSNARNSIRGDFKWENGGKDAIIYLSGNMEYSDKLELAHSKRYAILVPTIQRLGPEVIKGYQRLVK